MKKIVDGLKLGLGFAIMVSLFVFGIYLAKAWSGTDGLTAGAGDILTYDKWNQMLAKISSSLGGIIYDSPSNSYQFTGSIIAGSSSVCDASRKGAFRTTSTAVQVCDGTSWIYLKSFELGTESNPATSCLQIKNNIPSSTNRAYWIKNGANPAQQVWCDMDNGGWTLVVRISGTDEHRNINHVGGIISTPAQTGVWKLSDVDINAIPKSTGIKLVCNGTSYVFPTSCVFGATTVANGDCNPGGGNTGEKGLSSRPNTSPQLSYTNSGNGCRTVSTARGQSGQVRVK